MAVTHACMYCTLSPLRPAPLLLLLIVIVVVYLKGEVGKGGAGKLANSGLPASSVSEFQIFDPRAELS